jgi:hypothetical protein
MLGVMFRSHEALYLPCDFEVTYQQYADDSVHDE